MIFSEYVRLLTEHRLVESTAAAPIKEYIIGKPNYFRDVVWALDCIGHGKLTNHVKYGSQRATEEETKAHVMALENLLPSTLKVLNADELKYQLKHGDKEESKLKPEEKDLLNNYKLNKSYINSERIDLSESTPYGIQTDDLIRSIYYDSVNDDFYRITTTSTKSPKQTDKNKKVKEINSVNDNKVIVSIFRLSDKQVTDILDGLKKSGEYDVDYKNYIVSYKLMPKNYNLRRSLELSKKNK